jgi:hypothetical protein
VSPSQIKSGRRGSAALPKSGRAELPLGWKCSMKNFYPQLVRKLTLSIFGETLKSKLSVKNFQ